MTEPQDFSLFGRTCVVFPKGGDTEPDKGGGACPLMAAVYHSAAPSPLLIGFRSRRSVGLYLSDRSFWVPTRRSSPSTTLMRGSPLPERYFGPFGPEPRPRNILYLCG